MVQALEKMVSKPEFAELLNTLVHIKPKPRPGSVLSQDLHSPSSQSSGSRIPFASLWGSPDAPQRSPSPQNLQQHNPLPQGPHSPSPLSQVPHSPSPLSQDLHSSQSLPVPSRAILLICRGFNHTDENGDLSPEVRGCFHKPCRFHHICARCCSKEHGFYACISGSLDVLGLP